MPIYKVAGKKKDGLQQYRVVVNYTDVRGKYKKAERTAYGLPEAKATEIALQKEYEKGVSNLKFTVRELAEEYLKAKKFSVRETSFAKIEGNLGRYILPYVENVRIDKLTTTLLQDWKNTIERENFSIRHRQNIYSEFRALLNYAVKMEYLVKNPLLAVGNFVDPYDIISPEDKIQYYTAKEFKLYIACARETAISITDWGYYVFFNIAFYTGMRKGEINALKWSDIEGNKIHVRRSIAQKLKGGDRETPPKNKSSYRTLIMPLPLIKILNEHKERQKSIGRFSEDFRVCGGIKCLRDTSISNRNKTFAKAAGLKTIRIHDFRHTHASLLVNEGINIQEIARRLGHAKIEETWNTYSHLYPREEDRAIAILNKIA